MSATLARPYALVDLGGMLLARDLGYSDRDLCSLLELVVQLSGGLRLGAPLFQAMLPHLERQSATGGLAPATLDLIRREMALVGDLATGPEYRSLLSQVTELLTPRVAGLPHPDEPWSTAMLEWLRALDADSFAAWQQLLAHAMRAEQSKPAAKWMKEAEARVERIGFDEFKSSLLSWFGALEAPSTMPLSQHNCQVVKGLAWACSPYDDAELSRALGRLAEAMLFWIPQFPAMDWRGLRAGNACLYSLSAMPGNTPPAELMRLATRLKGKQLQDSVNKAIPAACQRRGMSRSDLEELTVPIAIAQQDGEAPARNGTSRRGSAAHHDNAAQRLRLETLLANDRSWSLGDWMQRYEQQPLLAPLVSRLIWQFETPERVQLGIPLQNRIIGIDGDELSIESGALVRLWHPVESDAGTVRSWRRLLEDRRIVQPFKQAHREVYVPAESDRASGRESNRFTGHVIRQDRFKALCNARDWRYSLQGRFMRGRGFAIRALAEQGIRALFEVQPVYMEGDRAGNGAFPYLETGSVRIEPAEGEHLPFGRVPARAFSEILRDVDLFVGVCSIGLDPRWSMPDRYVAIWDEQAIAELTQAATTRKEILGDLLPRLSFGRRCRVVGRFLIVEGELRTYKVHIGSGNVLMSPNDQFLYFPEPRRQAKAAESVFLPFEGDTLLAQILSRASVLAADCRISDRALRSQILAKV
jgi:hypothetical protein